MHLCSAHTVHGPKNALFQSKNCQELRDLQSVNNANTLVIEDDHFLSDNDRAKGVLRIARELGLKCVPKCFLYGLDRNFLEFSLLWCEATHVGSGIRQSPRLKKFNEETAQNRHH